VRRPSGSARSAASHQPITIAATGRTTVYLKASTAACIMGVATCQRLTRNCAPGPGPVKSQGLLPIASGLPESPLTDPLGDVGDPQPVRARRGEGPLDMVQPAVRGGPGYGRARPRGARDTRQAWVFHQPLGRAPRDRLGVGELRLAGELGVDLADPVDAVVVLVDPLDDRRFNSSSRIARCDGGRSFAACRMPHQATTRSSVSPSPATTLVRLRVLSSLAYQPGREPAPLRPGRAGVLSPTTVEFAMGGSGSCPPMAAGCRATRRLVVGDHPPCSEGLHGGPPCVRCCHAPERSCVRAKCVRHDHQHHRWLLPAGGTAAARVAPVGDGESRVALPFASDR